MDQALVFNHGFCILTRSFYFIVPLKDEVYISFSYFPCNGFDICGMLTNGSTRSWSRTALSFRGACFLSIHPLVLKIGLHLALKRKYTYSVSEIYYILYTMRKIFLSIMLVIWFLNFPLFAKDEDYQYFFPIPIDEFYGGTNDLHLSLQLACLKGEHLKEGSDFDPFWLPYCNLMKFVPSPYQQVDLSYYSGTTEEREKLHDTFSNIIGITIWLYNKASHKDQFHQRLQSFFHNWELSGSTQEMKRIGENMLRTVLGRKFIKSKISFNEVWQALKKEKRGTFKTDAEPLGHFVSLDNFGRVPGGLLAVGDYLFSEDGGILKKGDTHWQPFITIDVPDRELFHNYEMPNALVLTFRNHTLYYTLPKDMEKENHYLAPEYELQKDGSWRLNACFHRENLCPKNEECKLKQKKLPLKQCKNLWITLTTILWK